MRKLRKGLAEPLGLIHLGMGEFAAPMAVQIQ